MTANCRTAWYEPACRVVWQGCFLQWKPPMPIQAPSAMIRRTKSAVSGVCFYRIRHLLRPVKRGANTAGIV